MKAPLATYRVQLNKNFLFNDLKAIVPYLSQLGISHIYASPIFQAKKGSMHGYDITDPTVINEELGGRVGFEDLSREVAAYGLGWIQDIVPNHASYSLENKRICDVLAKGAESEYACFFDIDPGHPSPKLYGKLLAPFLPNPYMQCLKQGQITLIYNDGFKIKFNDLAFPVNAPTAQHLEINGPVPQTLEKFNRDPRFLNALLIRQYYRLAYWRVALKHINYRRFFDIIDLIGVRMENPAAFEWAHRLIFELAASGKFSGLRVDHIDGLYDPEEYLRKLRERCPEAYVLVEKILTDREQLHDGWPVEGTTGYDFISYVNKLFVKSSAEPQINALYRDFTGNTQAFNELLYETKKAVIKASFLGDVENLARLFSNTLQKLGYDVAFGHDVFERVVVELLANFPMYRAYLDEQHQDDTSFRVALGLAEQHYPQLAAGFKALAYLLREAKNSPEALEAVMRFQQFTGAVMAKGFEDTALYRYTRLLSLNEVGSSPDQFGVSTQEFHDFNSLRRQKWPLTLNATSTHDTKRGEDVRARLNVLSEVPDEFRAKVVEWAQVNAAKKRQVNGLTAPDGNEEYYLYQTLIGAYPLGTGDEAFSERIKLHMMKALREAKVHTNWLSPNLPYEEAVTSFVSKILESQSFLDQFLPFQKKVAFYGYFNSLAQTLLKATCPGIPDFYQGTELWDLNLVDPDNRQPINFQLRQKLLAEIIELKPAKAPTLLQTPADGRVKLYVIYKILQLRRKSQVLFEQGDYIPLAVKGTYAEHVVAFCRKKDNTYAMTIAPRFPTTLFNIREGEGAVDWSDTYISLPEGTPTRWSETFTEKTILSCCGRLPLRDVLTQFPVALLTGDSDA